MIRPAFLLLALSALPLASAHQEPAGPWRAVPPATGARLEPGDGPLALSPDGTTWATGRRDALAIGDASTGRVTVAPAPVGLHGFSHGRHEQPIAAWSPDGRAAWTLTQAVAQPSHFALGGLRVVRVTRAGAVAAVPPLRSPAGTLDALQWIGGDGRAIAGFGMGGAYYRPVHADRAPELAFVDAAHGRVLARLPLARLVPGRDPATLSVTAIRWVSGVALADGRLDLLVAIGGRTGPVLAHWTQGEAPVVFAHPRPAGDWTQGALLPSGRGFLLTRELRPDGIEQICEVWARCPRVPPPRPNSGALLERRDARDGHLIWSLRATANSFWHGDVLSLAPDGAHALVSYPPAAADRTERLALVRVRDGQVEQLLPGGSEAGFARGGRLIWVRTGGGLRYWVPARR